MNDWRLQGQEKYLKHAVLKLQAYQPFRKDWEHDHCEFCGNKFSLKLHDALKTGYATLNNYHWICDGCFDDFKNQFDWKLQSENVKSPPIS